MENNYFVNGPIAIRNGFLRSTEGNYTRLSDYQLCKVEKMERGPNPGNWSILFISEGAGSFFSPINFPTREEAQLTLDHIFSGGEVDFHDGVPVYPGNKRIERQ